jgi:transposase
MPAERLSMRQIRDVLRLCFAAKLPQRAIARSRSLGLSQGAISRYLSRARTAGITWPCPRISTTRSSKRCCSHRPPGPRRSATDADWAWVHRELRRADVTLALLWEEYRASVTDGFSYSWFCDLYRGWAGRLKPTMRQVHVAGEKLFVDFAGRTAEVVDANTGEIIPVQIFVATLARRASPTPRRRAARSCRIGSVRMSAPLPISAVPRELLKMLKHLAPGDVVTVTRIDRLARSTFDLFAIVKQIVDAKAQFRSLAEPWADTGTSTGRLMPNYWLTNGRAIPRDPGQHIPFRLKYRNSTWEEHRHE